MPITQTGIDAILATSIRQDPGFTQLYLALFTVAPTLFDATPGGGTEVDKWTTNYTRKTIEYYRWGSPSGGTIFELSSYTWPAATTDWGEIVAYGLMFSNSGFLAEHDFFLYDSVTPSYNVLTGDTVYFPGGTVSVSITNGP